MIKEEVGHALALLVVSIGGALGWIAWQSDDLALVGWFGAIAIVVAALLLAGLASRFEAKRQLRSKPVVAVGYFEWSVLAYIVPVGLILSVPLVMAVEFPTEWLDESETGNVLRLVLAYAVIEGIKLLALDGKWIKARLESDAAAMFWSAYQDDPPPQEIDGKPNPRYLAAFSPTYQGGWAKSSRRRRAEVLT